MNRFSCPKCKTVLQASPEQVGKSIACPKCKAQMKVPQTVRPSPAPVQPSPSATSEPAGQQALSRTAGPGQHLKVIGEKLKATWQGLTIPAKAGIIGGGAFMLLSCFLCCGISGMFTHSGASKKKDTLLARQLSGMSGRTQGSSASEPTFDGPDDADPMDMESRRDAHLEKRKETTADELKEMTFAQITNLLGAADEVYRPQNKPNPHMHIWNAGDDEYIVVVTFKNLMTGEHIVTLAYDHRTRSIVENMKRSLGKKSN